MTSPSVAAPLELTGERGRARYTRLATTGLVLMGAAPLLLFLVGLATGISLGEETSFLIILSVVPLLAAALAWRFGTWAKVVGIVVTLLAMFGGFWLAFGLFAPGAIADFVPAAMYVLGVVLSLGGNIAAIVRRNAIETATGRGESRILGITAALLALAIAASAIVSVVGRSTVSAEAAADATPVTIDNFEYPDGTYTVAAGEVSMVVRNSDAFVHDFAIPSLDVEPRFLTPGSSTLVEFTAPAGEYTIYCTIHSNVDETDPAAAGMAALLVAQ